MAQISREIYNFHISPTGPLWSDNHDDEEVISGNKPPGLCDQDVHVQMSDSSRHHNYRNSHSELSSGFSSGFQLLLVIISTAQEVTDEVVSLSYITQTGFDNLPPWQSG